MNEKVVKTLEKIGTVLVDRRFWVAVLAIILTLGGAFVFRKINFVKLETLLGMTERVLRCFSSR
jgi:hypothetical protein